MVVTVLVGLRARECLHGRSCDLVLDVRVCAFVCDCACEDVSVDIFPVVLVSGFECVCVCVCVCVSTMEQGDPVLAGYNYGKCSHDIISQHGFAQQTVCLLGFSASDIPND